jgi:hypothetical protein
MFFWEINMIRKLMWINDFDLKSKKEYIDDEKKDEDFWGWIRLCVLRNREQK